MPKAPYTRIRTIIDQCYFSTHLSATWTGNHRNASVIFSYNPRISLAPRVQTGVTRSYLIYALLVIIIVYNYCHSFLVSHAIRIFLLRAPGTSGRVARLIHLQQCTELGLYDYSSCCVRCLKVVIMRNVAIRCTIKHFFHNSRW